MDETFSWSLSLLATTPARWLQLTQALPAALLERPPAPGEWAALGCLQHLVDTEQVFQSRIQAFLEGRESFPAYDPDRQGTKTPDGTGGESLARRFAELRQASLQTLEKLAPEDASRRSRHLELGPVTLGEMVHEWAAHDLNHTLQAERALMQPFIAACGPWEVYFREHRVTQP